MVEILLWWHVYLIKKWMIPSCSRQRSKSRGIQIICLYLFRSYYSVDPPLFGCCPHGLALKEAAHRTISHDQKREKRECSYSSGLVSSIQVFLDQKQRPTRQIILKMRLNFYTKRPWRSRMPLQHQQR